MTRLPRALPALALLACACGVPGAGPMMSPGEDCVACHASGGGEPSWTAAGTVFSNPDDPVSEGVMNVRVTLTDANGKTVTLRSNRAGNFYTRESLSFPLLARIEKDGLVRAMALPVPRGGCNTCHAIPPQESAPGRIALHGADTVGSPLMNPGQDCLACHDGRAAQRWSSAGTVYATSGATAGAAGVTVRYLKNGAVVRELVSNAAGNFYTAEALPFPVQVEIQQGAIVRRMEPALDGPAASCNRCHGPGREQGRVSLSGGDD